MYMHKFLTRLAAGAFAVAVAAGGTLLGTAVANAAPAAGTLGSLTLNPATGSDLTAPAARTSAPCPATADSANMLITGPIGAADPTFPAANPYPIVTTTKASFSTTAPFDLPFRLNLKDAAADRGKTLQAGEYDITAQCVRGLTQEVFGTFTGAMYFTSPTAYQSTDPNAPVTTSTTMSVTPAAPVTQGTSVTLTATVSPASATGTVQFKDGGANLGAPVTVSGGTATLSTTALTAGTHSLTAVFTGSAPNIQGSTSAPVSYQVNAPVATPTTTSLAVSPTGTVPQFSTVTLNSTVSPSGAAGQVQFTDNGANLGAPVTLSGGTATFSTSALAPGAHAFTAKFVPANPAAFAASESAPVSLSVTAFTGSTASETISTTVAAGALLISVANQHVTLPSPTLLPNASMLTTSGSINPVTVADTRAGDPGWSCSGQVTDFTDGGSNAINGANLGWTPNIVDKDPHQTITAGPVVSPAPALAPGVPAQADQGLAASRTLATAVSGAGIGTAHLGAGLALNVPTTTKAGLYTSTLTLTVI